jgi:hypothetical protein
MPEIKGDLVPCENGYHLCRKADLVMWLGETIYEARSRGSVIEDEDKVVVREARLLRRVDKWDKRTARLFAADCAEHVLHIFERVYTDDHRPRMAIEAVRKFVNDEINITELDVAGDAARDAAWAAAMATAWDAAWDAAWAAAWAAERNWQIEKLFEYLGE